MISFSDPPHASRRLRQTQRRRNRPLHRRECISKQPRHLCRDAGVRKREIDRGHEPESPVRVRSAVALTGICAVCTERIKVKADEPLGRHRRRPTKPADCPASGIAPRPGFVQRKWPTTVRRLFGRRRRLDPRVSLGGPKRYVSSLVSLLTPTNHNHYDHILDWETLLLPR